MSNLQPSNSFWEVNVIHVASKQTLPAVAFLRFWLELLKKFIPASVSLLRVSFMFVTLGQSLRFVVIQVGCFGFPHQHLIDC